MSPIQTAAQIRHSFIEFFKSKEHQFIRSAPVVPLDDPTLLFTNAGMNQFKPIFLGENKDQLKRVANSQKCIRVSGKHNDLEVVGKDTYHHTFFEMLGNWSFGNYYKEEAIAWAWELLTQVWKLDPNRIFVTIHHTDDEAGKIWSKISKFPAHKIMKFGDKDNFWEMGDVGPCGPCSEIHYDTGDISTQSSTYSDPILGVNGENDRYIEIWNLVFIQYNRLQDGSLKPLPEKHVDTGMGFERVCAILQNQKSNYDTDVFSPILHEIAQASKVPYDRQEKGIPHRVIADHLRALTFSIADGALPSNEGRGYVLRRLLRRASKYARELGQKEAFIYQFVPKLVEIMGEAYPEIASRKNFVMEVIKSEEERFVRTLDSGLDRFYKVIKQLSQASKKEVSGEDAFTLYDTFGFPLDLTCLLAEENGFTVNINEYERCMAEQTERAKKSAKFGSTLTSEEGWVNIHEKTSSEFSGYHTTQLETEVIRYKQEGEYLYLFLKQTPFYAESGGQVGDKGSIQNNTVQLEVIDTISLMDMNAHKCKLVKGQLSGLHETVKAIVHLDLRQATMRNHSATHLLQAALQNILGPHVQQQGSRVSPEGLRFDFTHFSALTSDQIEQVENRVNQEIQNALEVNIHNKSFAEAQAEGAMALFGEKYGDVVRTIRMGNFSYELCGGTHVSNSGQIGFFKIISESSISAGVRRIEAITGMGALQHIQRQTQTLQLIAQTLKAKSGEEYQKVHELFEKTRLLEKELDQLRVAKAKEMAGSLLQNPQEILGIPVYISILPNLDKNETTPLLDGLQEKLTHGIGIYTQRQTETLSIHVLVSRNLTQQFKAGDLIKQLASLIGAKGGGKPDRAQAGGKDPSQENFILTQAPVIVKSYLEVCSGTH